MSTLLTKGFEVEMYTGRPDGTVEGCSREALTALPDLAMAIEPDRRNLEYLTPPDADYGRQLEHLLIPRQRLRSWLAGRGLTLLPGSTLSLGDSQHFERSDPANDYHAYIAATYGTRVVTASVHINIGLPDPESILAACRLLRCEAPLLLALSASSPFLDGAATGAHSQRWLQFPHTPEQVPLFLDHDHYQRWMGAEIQAGRMQNVRHLWTSARPNGIDRPRLLNRVELRICDLLADPLRLLAITALTEGRVRQLLDDPQALDPLRASRLTPGELAELADGNGRAAARSSIEATLQHWQDGRSLRARDWIAELIAETSARHDDLRPWLTPLGTILEEGNEAMAWLDQLQQGSSPAAILAQATRTMEEQELRLMAQLGRPAAVGTVQPGDALG
ncbi:MAG: glutamate--cysteine ligase [Synechococcus sp. Tobar2m-G35]|jgi:predicted glutamate--cysteine ligase|nr:glutamate--cysteine ligase [Synechococcus sp. Tobar2m-G35]